MSVLIENYVLQLIQTIAVLKHNNVVLHNVALIPCNLDTLHITEEWWLGI